MRINFSRLSKAHRPAGFTLVEVIISTALLGILIVGVMLFMAPLFSITQSSDMNKKADRVATTAEHYIAKSISNATFIKVFTNAEAADFGTSDGAIRKNTDMVAMLDLFKKTGYSANYDLRCIHIAYQEDANVRNGGVDSDNDGKLEKYMLYNAVINLSNVKFDKSSPVFEPSFYEDIYPSFEFEPLKARFDTSDKFINEGDKMYDLVEESGKKYLVDDKNQKLCDASGNPIEVGKETTPGIAIGIEVFDAEDMNAMSRVFEGVSYVETINTKGLSSNPSANYKVYDNTDVGTGTDTFIFYVVRKPGTVVGSGS